ncbi:14311_t:CDS:2 [Dentiscutata heterogama]|uniref:14311_t:CDS:1 n=1 Tax=Dentiscutata heterogama TaxID=1316150 RepID=A0ACA9M991_9GLOM|nr:14311_t:CDS:2 [Dentiscutata heterogama]
MVNTHEVMFGYRLHGIYEQFNLDISVVEVEKCKQCLRPKYMLKHASIHRRNNLYESGQPVA